VKGGKVHVVSWSTDNPKLQAVTIDSNGIAEEARYTTGNIALKPKVVVTGEHIVALSATQAAICSAPISSSSITFECADLPQHEGSASLSAAGTAATVHFAKSKTLVLVQLSSHKPVTIRTFERVTAASDIFLEGSEALIAIASPPATAAPVSLELAVHNVATGSSVYSIKIGAYPAVDAQGSVSSVAALWATPAKSSMGTAFFRFLLQAQDGTLLFSQKGNVLWSRHGALAQTRRALVVPLPATGNSNAPAPRPAMSVKDHLTLNALVLMVCLCCLVCQACCPHQFCSEFLVCAIEA
jgi:hypothetical protein